MGAFNRQRVQELHELWEKPRIDGKRMYDFRSKEERIAILRKLNLGGSEVLRNGEHPDSSFRYVPKFCYLDGILCCETSEEYQTGHVWCAGGVYAKKSANLLPQFVEIDSVMV